MRSRFTAVSLIGLLVLAGCATAPEDPSTSAPVDDGHGEIEGAHELAEPALHLTTIDQQGVVNHLDLLDEEISVMAEIEPIEDLVSDGRYLFGIRQDSVTIINSGVWAWSHGDHFHYYEAPAEVLGEVTGEGAATVVTGERGTGLLFDDEAVLLDTHKLADGEIVEKFRVDTEAHDGMLVPLLVGGALLTEADADGRVTSLRVLSDDGTPEGQIECVDAAGTITTPVGVVVGCADGAVLAVDGDAAEIERIPYPADAATHATEFEARKWRPRVAALAGDTGIWILDTRNREWAFHDLGEQIVRTVTVDDTMRHVLALAADGSVLVIVDGAVIARTEPLVAESLADPTTAGRIDFVVDQQRAYLNGPKEQTMWEIDPSDGARIARVFELDYTPLFLAGTGR